MNIQHIPGTVYSAGTRFSNSEVYDEATDEFMHGWQVFVQRRADDTPTGRESFINNYGVLCGIEIAEAERARAVIESAQDLLDVAKLLTLATNEGEDRAEGTHYVDKHGVIRCKGSFLDTIERARRAVNKACGRISVDDVLELAAEAASAMPVKWRPIDLGWVNEYEGELWLSLKCGRVERGTYEWQQGWSPDGFNTTGYGRVSADEVTHVMPAVVPTHPGKMA